VEVLCLTGVYAKRPAVERYMFAAVQRLAK
jgi:hypothetical protein